VALSRTRRLGWLLPGNGHARGIARDLPSREEVEMLSDCGREIPSQVDRDAMSILVRWSLRALALSILVALLVALFAAIVKSNAPIG
jgi:hypothetical protein